MRFIARIMMVLGFATLLMGEVVVFLEYDALRETATSDVNAIRKAQQDMWSVLGLGASFIAAGWLVNMVGQKARRRRYRRRSK